MTIRVAIIDDHPSITWGFERLIATEMPRMSPVGAAHDLAGARRLLHDARPDVALLDLDLDGASGIELISEFADDAIRFLVLTGLRDECARQEAVRAGARGVLSKSEQPATIIRAIDRVHAGELWLDRARTGELVDSLRRQARSAAAPFATLTPRERQIVAVALEYNGAPNKRIAEHLGIGENTLRNALSTIYSKTGVSNRLQLYALALRHPMR
ncbi:response regulator transcription factor [Aromatoleum evansii]|uniref:Response regulator transcription factor n=1 Tax=Aromatoleum evansii TaxID=59406 RepID=A0ABZ1AS74_AROEV|nr:response regulator transcription factor [Aromatoleum evansii]